MKKALAFLSMALMFLSLAAGCAAPAQQAASNPASPATEAPAAAPAAPAAPAADLYKVALLLPGSANDNSWNQFGYEAVLNAQKEIGLDKVEVAYSENVSTIDTAQYLRDYAAQGYNLIIGHGGQFEDDMVKIGPDFPNTDFVAVCGSYGGAEGSNVTAVDIAACQQGFSYGYLSGMITKTNKVGFVSALEGVQVMNNVTGGWKDGVKTANPDCTAVIVYVKDNNDVAEGREAALALAAAGCDVIMHELNAASSGVVEVCKEKGVATISRVQTDIEYAPDLVIGRFVFDWGAKYVDMIRMAMNGELNGGGNFFGYQSTPYGFSWYYDETNEWNPKLVTPEMIAEYETNVIEMFKKDPFRTYTTEDAAPGTY